jgi:hypothetical protein
VLFNVDFVNCEHGWFSRLAQHARQFFIDGRQSFLRIDNEEQKIAVVERFLCGATHLAAQFVPRLRDRQPAGIPQRERTRAAIANCGNPVACDSRLIMNNGNLPADQTIEQRGLAYVRPADDCDIWQDVRVVHRSGPNLGFRRVGMARSLQLPDTVCDVNDSGD